MLPFVPQHASSLLESTTNASLCHESSSHAAPELQNLSPQDIRIIDAVIERAGPSATTFFTVFKAYSEVLKEHGLDPQEVVYYGKLLKLGTLRGKNWGEKWVSVKSQMSQRRPASPTDAIVPAIPVRTTSRKAPQPDSLFSGKKIMPVPKERPKERSKPAVDIDEAWKNIKMEQDEKYADEFRDNLLLNRCWDIWRQGYLWIIVTHQQIQEARDNLVLTIFMKKWRDRLASQRALEDQRVARFSIRLLKHRFDVWKAKYKKKRQALWREDMRQKMKIVKRKAEIRIKRDAWTKWQRMLLLHRAQRHYEIGLLYRSLGKWQEKIARVKSLEQHADIFLKETDLKVLDRLWNLWTFNTILRHKLQVMTRRVENRIVADALDKWKTRMSQLHMADTFHDDQILRRTVNRWKTAKALKANLEIRADRYIARKDTLLLRAIVRIWRARMRGVKLQRFKEITTLQNAWQKWSYRLSKERAQTDVADKFLNRTSTRLLATTFQRWQQVFTSHQNALAYATTYDQAHLQSRMLLAWRMKLHDRLRLAKVARWANRYFVTRSALRVWIGALEDKRRERKLRDFEVAKLRKVFDVWKCRTSQARYLRQCEILLREHMEMRVLHTTLTHWTNRVIEIKSRELDVAQQADVALLRAAFSKWRNCRRRHEEEVSLLENYLLVKREDLLRRAFHRWLTVRRAAQHRRLTHQRKEGMLRQILITSAWDRWRERFKEEKLRPLEYQLILDHQRHVLQSAFKVWVGKADSLPAVRFHSRNLKAKFFGVWKNALPTALKVKKARETDRHNTLARYFQKWAQAYKTKTTLKAVERAKYLRLPILSSRQLPKPSRPRPFYNGASLFPRRRSISSDDEDTRAEENDVVITRRPFLIRAPIIQQASEKNASRSEGAPSVGRQQSPVRSIVSLPDRRSRSPSKPDSVTETLAGSDRLWEALRKAGQGRRPRRL